MNKLKHTPAPWKQGTMRTCICQNNDTCSHIFEKECYIFPTTDDIGPIAIISDEANARLIAAAPEMLEALIKIIKKDKLEFNCAKVKCLECDLFSKCEVPSYGIIIEKATGQKFDDVLK